MDSESRKTEQWAVISGLFEEASSLAPEQWAAYLERQTTDPELRHEVLELLQSASKNEAFLEEPIGISSLTLLDPLEGSMAGNCRLIRLLGEGGMGRVYEGIRKFAVPEGGAGGPAPEQRVAVKIWHRGILDAEAMRREAGMLARVEHPGIARLLDTGQLANGQSFLVMELVEGTPIHEYAQGKTLEEKLVLISKVCEALEAAHGALIAHRDIKPGNILVNRDGVPKLIDFGISKAVDDGTVTVDFRLTPRYASPEQLRGEAITTATDIYSLGVVMKEVLGEGKLPRDVVSIVLKAMAQAPTDRYGSVMALREDIGRFRKGEPVRAVEATLRYRFGKFVKRQRVPLGIGVVALALIGIGFGRAYWEARQAGKRFEQVRRLARSLLFEIHDEVSKVPGTLESRQLILARALEYLDQLAADESAEAGLQKDLAESYMKVGFLQGTTVRSSEMLGRYRDSRSSYSKAIAILERLKPGQSRDRELRLMLARSHERRGDACDKLGDTGCAADGHRVAFELYAEDARENPGDYMAQARWLTARIAKLEPLVPKQEYGALREGLKEVAAAFEVLDQKHPQEKPLWPFVAYSYKRLGAVEGVLGNFDAAVAWYGKAREIHRKQGDMLGMSTCDVDVAWVRGKQKNWKAALEALDRGLDIRRKLAVGRGMDQQSKMSLASALHRKAEVLEEMGQWAEAEKLSVEGRNLLEPLAKGEAQNPQIGLMLRLIYLMHGDELWELNRKAEAREEYRKGLNGKNAVREEMIERARKRTGLAPLSLPDKPSR